MKRIFYTFLMIAFLSSCNSLPALNATATPQATFTLTPTFTPTITPTITATPTETPDPNMPSDATGKDPVSGDYTKTVEENGKTVVYIWKQFQFGDDSKNGVTGHWFKSWMANGPINLINYGEICPDHWEWGESLSTLTLNMNVYAVENQVDLDKIGYIFHPDRKSAWEEYGNLLCGGLSLPYKILSDLFLRYINLLPGELGESSWDKYERQRDYYYPNGGTEEEQKRWADDHKAFAKGLNDGSMNIKIGEDYWIPKNGYEVYWIDEAMVMNDPTFLVNLQGYTIKSYYLKVIVQDGKLIAFIAPGSWLKQQLAQLKIDSRERMFKTMILFPLEAAINSTFPIPNASFGSFQSYGSVTGTISGTGNGKSFYIDIPFIDFTEVP